MKKGHMQIVNNMMVVMQIFTKIIAHKPQASMKNLRACKA